MACRCASTYAKYVRDVEGLSASEFKRSLRGFDSFARGWKRRKEPGRRQVGEVPPLYLEWAVKETERSERRGETSVLISYQAMLLNESISYN